MEDIEDIQQQQSVAKTLTHHELISMSDDYLQKPRSIKSDADIQQITSILNILLKSVDSISSGGLIKFLTKHGRLEKRFASKQELLYIYRMTYTEHDPKIIKLLQTKPQRSASGVMVYAILTPPLWEEAGGTSEFSCKYDCSYCPKEPNMPRSYISKEPGVMRANNVNFDTVLQMYERYNQYRACGHPNDKAEIIVLGGTWHSYTLAVRRKFITDLFYAANTLHENRKREKLTMEDEISMNEESKCRIIGITIETRPDQINGPEIVQLRKMGITRVQLGVQHINDEILERINRRCSNKHTINTFKLLKDCCFKIDAHLMPDLPQPIGSSINVLEEDYAMLEAVIEDSKYKPDQLKVYPCAVVPWTKLKEEYDQGVYTPYGSINGETTPEMIDLLLWFKSRTPEWIRLNRIVRDIPGSFISGGVKDESLREGLQSLMHSRGLECRCIRCREIKTASFTGSPKLKVIEYPASDGDEYFIQWETENSKIILGFLRLRITSNAGRSLTGDIIFPELIGCALIRELHIYGQTTEVNRTGDSKSSNVQHNGLGKGLLSKAEQIAKEAGYNKLAVISGQGVKSYYRKNGFSDEGNFLTKLI